jgi:type II secretory pathway predicted ATPase ExeA
MYATHFGLRERPFRATPDSACYYPATSHEQTLARLQQAVADDEGMLLLTGEPGTGKTLLGHCLLERLGPDVVSAFVTNSHLGNRAALLQALAYDLGLPYEGRSEQELRLLLTDFLLRNFAAGKRTVLVLDEAQHLAPELLEELRLLANLEARRAKAVQVLLVAQPGLVATLRRQELAALAQRLAVRSQLAPLGLEEAVDYLLHQVRLSGGRPQAVLTEEALEILARAGQGVPRLLNQVAHQALTLAFAAGATVVDAEAALEAAAFLGLSAEEAPARTEAFEPTDGPAETNGAAADGRVSGGLLALETALGEDGTPAVEPATEDGQACRLFTAP